MARDKRLLSIYIFTALFFAIIIFRLIGLQIVNGEENKRNADARQMLTKETFAPRGRILDRYGRELVKNKTGYYLAVEKTKETYEERNEQILTAAKILKKHNKLSIDDDKILEAINEDMKKSGFSVTTPYILCDELTDELITIFKENEKALPSIKILSRPVREYIYPKTASHLLGRVGKISEDELKEDENKSLNQNDYIGKQGAEKAFEKYLRGTKGIKSYRESLKLKGFKTEGEKKEISGNDVLLTIDLDLQLAAEEALKKAATKNNGAAAVAENVNTGEILAAASYPTYDISTFGEKYGELINDKALPMFNRAFSGLYEPGSTFKPITAIAAIDKGVIDADTKINTKGKYEFKNHTFLCNTYKKTGKTHGAINASEAIKYSCNYFFFEVSSRCGIDEIVSVAKSFGMDSKTGVELYSEEKSGKIASPNSRRQEGRIWYPGDTLQASIGQSDNLFTPLALSNYTAALANGGTVYKTTVLKQVNDGTTNEILFKNTPEILCRADASRVALSSVKEGMAGVCKQGGTAGEAFKDFSVSVCAKTGSAETKGSTNGVFICYAPAENPVIAVSVVLEKGLSGTNAAYVAKDILKAYFEKNNKPMESEEIYAPYTLKP